MADDLPKRELRDLYERDFVAWTTEQAAALRARRGGANALDYDNLAEEVEDLGKSETRACLSLVDRIIEHLLKIEFVGGQDAPHWRGEVRAFRRDLRRTLTPTIEHKVRQGLGEALRDVAAQLRDAGRLTPDEADRAGQGGYAWEQVVDPDWYPETRAD